MHESGCVKVCGCRPWEPQPHPASAGVGKPAMHEVAEGRAPEHLGLAVRSGKLVSCALGKGAKVTFLATASGAKNDRIQRKKVLALAQAHEIDAILVTELSRWGRSTQDLVQTLDDLHG